VPKRLDDTTKSKDQAGLIRKRESRKKLGKRPAKKDQPRLADLILSPKDMKAIERLLGPSIPKAVERSFIGQIIKHRGKINAYRAAYAKKRKLPLLYGVDCINSFVLNVTTGQRACYCIGKTCPRRDIEKRMSRSLVARLKQM
jgi:hypothetical protein